MEQRSISGPLWTTEFPVAGKLTTRESAPPGAPLSREACHVVGSIETHAIRKMDLVRTVPELSPDHAPPAVVARPGKLTAPESAPPGAPLSREASHVVGSIETPRNSKD